MCLLTALRTLQRGRAVYCGKVIISFIDHPSLIRTNLEALRVNKLCDREWLISESESHCLYHGGKERNCNPIARWRCLAIGNLESDGNRKQNFPFCDLDVWKVSNISHGRGWLLISWTPLVIHHNDKKAFYFEKGKFAGKKNPVILGFLASNPTEL